MFGKGTVKKTKLSKKEKKRKNRGNHHHQSVECIGRSYQKVNQLQKSSQFLPDVVKSTKSNKTGSITRGMLKKEDECYNVAHTYETLSDEKVSQAVSSSEKESKGLQSSSNSRSNRTYRKPMSIYGDSTIENLRNLSKAEKELRGIFYAVKQYEFPIIKDAEGNIKIGRYQPSKITKNVPFRPPSRWKFDIAIRGQIENNETQLESISERKELNSNANNQEEIAQKETKDYNREQQCSSSTQMFPPFHSNLETDSQNVPSQKKWETSTIASSTFYSDNQKQNDFLVQQHQLPH